LLPGSGLLLGDDGWLVGGRQLLLLGRELIYAGARAGEIARNGRLRCRHTAGDLLLPGSGLLLGDDGRLARGGQLLLLGRRLIYAGPRAGDIARNGRLRRRHTAGDLLLPGSGLLLGDDGRLARG